MVKICWLGSLELNFVKLRRKKAFHKRRHQNTVRWRPLKGKNFSPYIFILWPYMSLPPHEATWFCEIGHWNLFFFCIFLYVDMYNRVQWFWLFFTFWGITTHPWHPKCPRIWKLAKKFFQLHPWPAEIFGKNRKMRFLV